MKRISNLLFVVFLGSLIFSSCSDTKTYAELLKDEKVLIADYIKKENINVLHSFPADDAWGENDYVLTASGLYFHLVSPGTVTDTVTLEVNDLVVPRFVQYTLGVESDTISNWNTIDFPRPITFHYGNTGEVCVAWHEAVGYMKKNESEAKLIVPSKLGFNDYMMAVTPLGYDFKIKIQK